MVLGFRVLGFYGFRVLGFRILGFRGCGFSDEACDMVLGECRDFGESVYTLDVPLRRP